MKNKKIKDAVILVGGLGKRLRPLTKLVPKPLLPIGNSTVLEILIYQLKKNGIKRVYLATRHLHKQISKRIKNKKFGVEIIYSKEKKKLGTCGPLSLLESKINSPILLMNGDIITNLNFKKLFNFFFKQKTILTVATKKISVPFEFGKIVSKKGYITSIEEKPTFIEEILAGIYILDHSCLKLIPKNKYYGIDDFIKKLLRKKIRISKYIINDYWVDIGTKETYNKSRKKFDKK